MELKDAITESMQEIKTVAQKDNDTPQKAEVYGAEAVDGNSQSQEGAEAKAGIENKEGDESKKDKNHKEQSTTGQASKAATDKFEEYLLDTLKPKYAALDGTNKALFKDIYKDINAGFTKRAQQFAAKEQEYSAIQSELADFTKALAPVTQGYKDPEAFISFVRSAQNFEPELTKNPEAFISFVRGAQNFEAELTKNPLRTISMLCAQAGIDPKTLGEFKPNESEEAIRPLIGEIAELKNLLAARQSAADNTQIKPWQEQQEDNIEPTELAAFRNAKAEDGSPLHPHFEKVAQIMGMIMLRDGHEDLDKAYKEAIMTLPEVRDSAFKTEAARAYKAQADIDKAKKAAGLQLSSSSQEGGRKTPRTLREMLSESVQEIKNS